jgi:hypothetical protein
MWDTSLDFKMEVLPAQFDPVGSSVVAIPGKPSGTVGGELVNSGTGCAERLSVTGTFLDRDSKVVAVLTWAAPPTAIFQTGVRVPYEVCCLTNDQAAQVSAVQLAGNWLNRPCS